jgi:DNA-binding transcriptional LysR family regulator
MRYTVPYNADPKRKFAAEATPRLRLASKRRLTKGFLRHSSKLRDFRHDKFISFDQETGFGYEQWVRGLCQRLGKFEPEIGALANSPDSLISMVAAGRGVFIGPEIPIRGRTAAIDFYPLTEADSQFEVFTIWKKQSQTAPTISKFIEVLQESIKPV